MTIKLTHELLKRALTPLLVWLWEIDYVDNTPDENNFRNRISYLINTEPLIKLCHEERGIIGEAAYYLKGGVEYLKTVKEENTIDFSFSEANDKMHEALFMFREFNKFKKLYKTPYLYRDAMDHLWKATLQQGVLIWLYSVINEADLSKTQAEYESMYIKNICDASMKLGI